MKKIILKVRQSGLMFNLNGKKFRSPAEIDITHMKIDPVIGQMRSYGITDYEISTIENTVDLLKNKNNFKSKIIIIESKNDEIDHLNSRVERLEKVLHKLLDQNKDNNSNNNKKEWEQNNKDISSLQKDEIDKPTIEEIVDVHESKCHSIGSNKLSNIDTELLNKKIIIEELEETEDIEIELNSKKNEFKTKDFHYEEIKDSFQLFSDIENLKQYKK
jgi:TolA-binding protein